MSVGYGKPPKHGQFKKGMSGNPHGRPKHSKNFMTLLDDELKTNVIIQENGAKKTITKMEAMIKRMITGALQGDPRCLKNLLDILKHTERLRDEEPSPLQAEKSNHILERYVKRQIDEARAKLKAELSAKQEHAHDKQ